jgi:hypothetical protein
MKSLRYDSKSDRKQKDIGNDIQRSHQNRVVRVWQEIHVSSGDHVTVRVDTFAKANAKGTHSMSFDSSPSRKTECWPRTIKNGGQLNTTMLLFV